MAWLAVNPDFGYKIFNNKPVRKILSSTNMIWYDLVDDTCGIDINPVNLHPNLGDLTWDDNSIEI